MLSKVITKLDVALIICILFISAQIFAQSGKISGFVYDYTTKEPLIGVNVFIEGSNLGAATDLDGRFLILNVMPGKYNVLASMISYGKVIQKDVRVNIDRTTELKFFLKDESLQIEQVVITAEKRAIVKDRTSTSTNIDAEQITASPVEGLSGVLEFSAGIQKDEKGAFSVRGSGANEVSFQINGVEQINSNTSVPGSFGTEKANNSWKYDVNPIGVQQLELITGGFSAEYGNAQAGVVKVVLKEGTPKLTGEFRVEYRSSGQYHYGEYLYDKNNYEWKKWGSLENWLDPNNPDRETILTSLGTSEIDQYKDSNPELYRQKINELLTWGHDIWVDNHEPRDDHSLGIYDYRKESYTRYLFGFGGPLGKDPNLLKFYFSGEYKKSPTRLPTPERNQILQNYILNVTYNPVINNKFKLMASYQQYIGGIWSGSSDIRWSGLPFTPPSASKKYVIDFDPVRKEQTIAQSLNWVHTINNQSFFELNLSHQEEKYELPFKYLPGYNLEADRLDGISDSVGTILKPGIWWESNYYFAPQSFSTNSYQDQRTSNFNVKIDYVNQILSTNLLKTGISFSYWDMFNNGVNSSFQANSFVARNGFAEYYKAYPWNFSAYFQDKMEYEGMVANIGLRAEAYNFQAQVPIDPANYLYTGTDGPKTGDPSTENSKTRFILMPRVGISFPIGESTAFRFQYGHFSSMPIFSQALSNRTSRGWSGIANPNLDPKTTINYEFGIQQVLSENNRLDVSLYYNDRTNQVGSQKMRSYNGSQLVSNPSDSKIGLGNETIYSYNSYLNNSFGATIGLELVIESIRTSNWMYRLSYSISQTTSGKYGAEYLDLDGTFEYTSNPLYSDESIASWDKTHNLRGLLQYFIREDEGIQIIGIKPFENCVFSLTYTAQSGIPFTYTTEFQEVKDVSNNRRYPIETNVDFSFTKDIQINGVKLLLGLRVMNLFDNKWLTPIYNSENIGNWVENGITYADPGNDPLRPEYITAYYTAYRNIPRQVFFTLGIGF